MLYLTIYLLILFLSIFNVFFSSSQINNVKFLAFIYIALLLIILSAFRLNVGSDYYSYIAMFNEIVDGISTTEHGFQILFEIIYFTTYSYEVAFAVFSIFPLFIIFKEMYKNSSYIYLSLLLFYSYYYYLFYFGLIRQGIVLAIIIFSIKFILKKQPFRFYLLIIFGSLMHSSSLFALPLYYLSQFKYSKKRILSFMFVGLLAGIFVVNSNISMLVGFDIEYVVTKLTLYENSAKSSIGQLFILELILFFYTLYLLPKKDYYFIAYSYGIFLKLLFINLDIIGWRLGINFMPMIIFIAPHVLFVHNNKSIHRLSYFMLLLVYSMIYFYITYEFHLHGKSYKSIFEF